MTVNKPSALLRTLARSSRAIWISKPRYTPVAKYRCVQGKAVSSRQVHIVLVLNLLLSAVSKLEIDLLKTATRFSQIWEKLSFVNNQQDQAAQ